MIKTVDFPVSQLVDRCEKRGQPGQMVFMPAIGNIIKVIVFMVLFISWLDNIGVRVTTLVAGLGIGGLAVALAAQNNFQKFHWRHYPLHLPSVASGRLLPIWSNGGNGGRTWLAVNPDSVFGSNTYQLTQCRFFEYAIGKLYQA